MNGIRLDKYNLGSYTPGAPFWKQILWFFVGAPLFQSYFLPLSSFKVFILRCFGAKIGKGVYIKPGVKVKFPWRLSIGDYCWIGEAAWLDNVASIRLDDHICLSQGVYLCTGNHNWSDPHMGLCEAPIHLKSGCWIAAKAILGPGIVVEEGAVLCAGGVATRKLERMVIYSGNPAIAIKSRTIKEPIMNT